MTINPTDTDSGFFNPAVPLPLFDYHFSDYSFGFALQALKDGRSVRRSGWPAETHVSLMQNTPYLYQTSNKGARSTYSPTSFDLLSSDWQVL